MSSFKNSLKRGGEKATLTEQWEIVAAGSSAKRSSDWQRLYRTWEHPVVLKL